MFQNIQPDKWKHFVVGIAMGAFLQVAGFWLLPYSFAVTTLIVGLLVVAISYGFELFSKLSGLGHYDVKDAIASVIGGIIGMALVIFPKYYFFAEHMIG